MKGHITYLNLALLATVLSIVSCIKDEEAVTSPECYISSFKIADVKTTVWSTDEDGEKTSYTRTLSGSDVFFRIDQLAGTIETVDSLPEWLDVSRIVPTVSYSGTLYYRTQGGESYLALSNGKDSIDFTNPVDFMVTSLDGTASKTYSAKINLASSVQDSLYWTLSTRMDEMAAWQKKRMVRMGENKLCILGEKDGTTCVTMGSVGVKDISFTSPVAVGTNGDGLQSLSVMPWKDVLVGLDQNGFICRSLNGIDWEIVSQRRLNRLLATDVYRVYGWTESDGLVSTEDFVTWREEGVVDGDLLPVLPIYCMSYATRTNTALQHVVMVGLRDSGQSAVWYKVSALGAADQPWSYIDDKAFPLPSLQGLAVVRWGDSLIAFGGQKNELTGLMEFSNFYCSDDNGISWHQISSRIAWPDELSTANYTDVSAVDCNGRLWLLSDDGRLWEGSEK